MKVSYLSFINCWTEYRRSSTNVLTCFYNTFFINVDNNEFSYVLFRVYFIFSSDCFRILRWQHGFSILWLYLEKQGDGKSFVWPKSTHLGLYSLRSSESTNPVRDMTRYSFNFDVLVTTAPLLRWLTYILPSLTLVTWTPL